VPRSMKRVLVVVVVKKEHREPNMSY